MAMLSVQVTTDVVEATEFPELAQRYQEMAVPRIVIDDRVESTRAQPESRVLAEVKRALAPERVP
jgi:hypothetical protein